MIDNMIINQKLMLSDIIDPNFITKEHDFEYAGVKGFAELIGWKIVFFKTNKNSGVDAIRMFEIETKDEIEICNLILQKIEFPLNFNSNLYEIYSNFATEISKEKKLVDCVTYCFKLNECCYISFDISYEKIKGIQIICNKKIIDNILN